MNAEIPPGDFLSLRKQVERAVRPVRAGKRRKLLMREELLAHLVALYEEERSRRPDAGTADAALREALARFGDPAALTVELSGSVGWQERWKFHEDRLGGVVDRWFAYRDETPLTKVVLRAGLMMGLGTLFLAASLSICALFDPERLTVPTKYPLLLKLLAFQGLALWTFLVAIHATCRALGDRPQRRWLTAGLHALAWTLPIVLLGMAVRYWISADGALERLPVTAAFGFLLLPAGLLLLAWFIRADAAKQRVYREWQSLELD